MRSLSDPDSSPDPVFILGIMHRSGTNYLHDLLCLHPDCASGGLIWEDFLLAHADLLVKYAGSVPQDWNPRWKVGEYMDPPALLSRCLGDGLISFLKLQLECRRPVGGPMATLPPESSPPAFPRRLITKTPSVKNLQYFFTIFPRARLLIVVRDGRSLVESAVKSFGWKYEPTMRKWAEAARTILEFDREQRDSEYKYLIVKYEDLFNDLGKELNEIFSFLDLEAQSYDFDTARNMPIRGSCESRGRGAGRMDWKPVKRTAQFNPLTRWSHWRRSLHRRFNWIAGECLEQFGYAREPIPGDKFPWNLLNILLDARWRVRTALRWLVLNFFSAQETPAPKQTDDGMKKADPIKVVHLPYFKMNPYQKCLLENLREIGVETQAGRTVVLFSLLHAFFTRPRPDIFHLHWLPPLSSLKSRFGTVFKSVSFVLEILILKTLGTRVVWTVHNLKSHDIKFERIESFFTGLVARSADKIIVHCETAKSLVKRAFKIKKGDRLVVIHHGNYLTCYDNSATPAEARKELGLSLTDFVFLYLGQVRPYRGVLELIDAFRRIGGRKEKLLIAGKPHSDQFAARLELGARGNKNIRIIDKFIPEEEVQVYLNAADAVVFPYRRVLTSGGVILAMSFGKAVIAPRLGCIPETLDSSGGFLYDPDEKDGLLKVMRKALASKSELQEMGRYNLKLAEKLDWKKIAWSTLKVYEDCLRI